MNGLAYPMEMHLVHYKADFANISQAVQDVTEDTLAVLGIFFRVSTNLLFENNDLCSTFKP